MNRDEIRDSVLRLLLVYPISVGSGYHIEDICTYLSSLFVDLIGDNTLKSEVVSIMPELEAVQYIESHEIMPGYITTEMIEKNKKTVTFYFLTQSGIAKAQSINNQKIVDAILEGKEKDLILLNHCLKYFTPYMKFSKNKLNDYIKQCVLKLPLTDQMRLTDHKTYIRFFDFLLNGGFIEQIDADNYEFNLRGRRLLEKGSYDLFADWEIEQQEKENEKKELEHKLLKSQNDFQTLNNDFISRQSELIESQKEANQSQIAANELSKITNIYIAVFTGLGGLYALFQLLTSLVPDRISHRALIIYLVMTFAVLAGIVGYRRIALIHRQSRIKKGP